MVLDYPKTFEQFFEQGRLHGTYKCVFLHALTDIELHNDDNISEDLLISRKGNNVILDLNFVAIRFAAAYWDIVDLPIRHRRDIPNNAPKERDINVLKNIRKEKSKHGKKPSLEDFASNKMSDFRKTIIEKSIKQSVLKGLETDFGDMFKKIGTNQIKFPVSLVDFLKQNRDEIRKKLEVKLSEHLRSINSNVESMNEISIERSNPFFRYVNGVKRVCLFQMNEEVEQQVMLQTQKFMWKLQPTQNNKNIWDKVRTGDIVLFYRDYMCMKKGTVLSKQKHEDKLQLQNDAGKNNVDVLSIIFDNIVPINIDLQNSRIRLVDIIISNKHNSSIQFVAENVISRLESVYGEINEALENISEPSREHKIHDTKVELVSGKTKIRRGQQTFRNQILKNYKYKCAVCPITQQNLLEASHILPVRHSDSAGDVNNGICFCVLHHKMFDKGYIFFDVKYNLVFAKNTSSYLKNTCTNMQITKSNCHTLPSKDRLKQLLKLLNLKDDAM